MQNSTKDQGVHRRRALEKWTQQGAAERQEWSAEEPSSEPSRANPPSPRSEARSPTDRPLGSEGCWVLPLPQVQAEPSGAMASPSSSPEDTGKLRGRDGRQRREAEDAPPEEKRLRLGLEGGSAASEEGEDAPRLGREETGTQTGVEDGGDLPSLPYSLVEGQDYTSEHSACLSSANNSPHDSVSASLASSKTEETAWRTHASGTYSFPDQTQHSR
ncbi:uncharacterized protein LOC133063956 [Dama dama]|uniref:uncharacterized protein LOC133063956 n=1 Tax=Dama dama TaxID=30532 RepID=UPI002A35B591|nr:uncharacterized protein LOC133063956 [Dama dama]